jgi:hypothetical protein
LIPTDVLIENGRIDPDNAINLRAALTAVSKARSLGLIILDACRNNPLVIVSKDKSAVAGTNDSDRNAGVSRSVGKGLAPVTSSPESVLVAFAAKDGSTADDGDGRNSPFTGALLRHIETPGLEISNLFRNVRDDVMSATGGEQQPFVYGSLSKQGVFLKPLPFQTNGANDANLIEAANQPENPAFRGPGEKAVISFAGTKKIPLPLFQINAVDPNTPIQFRRFLGVWGSNVGYNFVGRQAMLIVTSASPEGDVNGYVLWGPPTKSSFAPIPAGYTEFASKIIGSTFQIERQFGVTYVTMLEGKAIKMRDVHKDGKLATVDLYSIWTEADVGKH